MSPSHPAERRLQEISHLFLSSPLARSAPPSALQPDRAASEPRRSLPPPRVVAVGSATDPLVTGFLACRLALQLRAQGRRVLLFDAAGQPWFLQRFLGVEEGDGQHESPPCPSRLHDRGLAWFSAPSPPTACAAAGDAPLPDLGRLVAAEGEADLLLVLLPCHCLAAYLERFSSPRQEFLVATGNAWQEVGRAFARLRQIHGRLPAARLGAIPVGAIERLEAETCFRRLAHAGQTLLGAEVLSYGYLTVTGGGLRSLASGLDLDAAAGERIDSQAAAIANLLLVDGRPGTSDHNTPSGLFFDVLVPNPG